MKYSVIFKKSIKQTKYGKSCSFLHNAKFFAYPSPPHFFGFLLFSPPPHTFAELVPSQVYAFSVFEYSDCYNFNKNNRVSFMTSYTTTFSNVFS